MNEIVKRNTTLPANFAEQLMKGIEDTRSHMAVSEGGKPFLRLLKSGNWVFGPQNNDVQQGSRWAVNLASLQRGWCCWGEGELLGQVMGSIQAPRLPQPAPIDGIAFSEQFSMELTCIDGDDAGQLVLYKNNSYGFKVAFDALVSAIRNQYAVDPVHYWPVISLHEEDYDHKRYGQTWNPILVIEAWTDAEGHFAEAAKAVQTPAAEPAPATAKPRKAPLKPVDGAQNAKATEEALERVEPVSTIQTRVGQRRRPVAR